MDTTTERNELEGKLIPELQQIAQGLGIEGSQKLRKAGLIDAIVSRSADDGTSANGPVPVQIVRGSCIEHFPKYVFYTIINIIFMDINYTSVSYKSKP